MSSRLIRDRGEPVTIIRLSDDKGEETIVAKDIVCLIRPVEGQYEHWKAAFDVANIDIRKGDILRRDDRSELQVLRVISGKGGGRIGEITQLDLKDYNRQEPPLEKKEMDVSESELPKHEFHPIIAQKVWSMFSQGNYDPAVLQAFKEVEIAVREAGNYDEADHGVPLMRKSFHQDTGNLTDTNQPSAERIALEHLFVGAMGYCRNPTADSKWNSK